NHFAGFAISDLNSINNTRALIRGHGEAIDQAKDGLSEIDVEQRFWRGEFKDLAILEEAIEATLAKFEQAGFESFECGGVLRGARAGRPRNSRRGAGATVGGRLMGASFFFGFFGCTGRRRLWWL